MLWVWELGIRTQSLALLQNCPLTFAYCQNCLGESSVIRIPNNNVWFQGPSFLTRVHSWKQRNASSEFLLEYHRVSSISSPLDLTQHWKHMRLPQERFFTTGFDPVEWEHGSLTAAMAGVFYTSRIKHTRDGKYSSHLLRIGARIEQALNGITVEPRLARFEWNQNSAGMAALYFDRSLRYSAAYRWYSGTAPSATTADSSAAIPSHPAPLHPCSQRIWGYIIWLWSGLGIFYTGFRIV